MTAVYGMLIAMALIVVFLGMLIIGLLRSHGEILRRLESQGAGTGDAHNHESAITLSATKTATRSVPDIAGVDPQGSPVVASVTLGDDPTLLAFLSTSCSSCTMFWENLDSSTRYFGDHRHRVVIVTRGEDEESPTRTISLARGSADVIMSSSAWEEFKVPGAPYFVLVDPGSGIVLGEGSASTFDALEEFLMDASNDQQWDRKRAKKHKSDAVREAKIDDELRASGLEPGDPRMYPSQGDIAERPDE